MRFGDGLVNDLVNKITSNRLIFCLRVKDTRRISLGKHLSTLQRNVLQIHLLQAAQRRIHRSVCKKLYASHIVYDWVARRKYVCEEVEAKAVRECRLE